MVTGFVKNTNRIDPYKNNQFRVEMDGKPVLPGALEANIPLRICP
jgi:hypothetical protein